MNQKELAGLTSKLCSYFQKPLPDAKTIRLWHQVLQSIPESASAGLYDVLVAEWDYFPGNLPKALLDIHFKRGKYQEYGPVYREVTFDD